MLIGIAAIRESDGLMGKGNGLPWHLPSDLKFFKAVTENSTLVMGRTTWESLPPMGERKEIVYTRNLDKEQTETFKQINSLEGIIDLAFDKEKYYLIGGAYMFKVFGAACEFFFITKVKDVKEEFEGDVFFPLDLLDKFEKIRENSRVDETTGIELVFELYRRKRDARMSTSV